MFYTAPLNTTCPEDFRIEERETTIKSILISRSLPVTVTPSRVIGSTTNTSTASRLQVTWSLSGNDTELVLNHAVMVTWNVTYVDLACSGSISSSSAEANCLAINTSSTCTTSVLKVSKSPNVLNYLCLMK